MSIAWYPTQRMLVLVAGALLIGLIAQFGASSADGGICNLQIQICAHAW